MRIKEKEILGYHTFAEESGWDGSYESFLERMNNGQQSPYFNFLYNIINSKAGKLLDFASGT